MENQSDLFQLKLNNQAIEALKESARWSFFLSIVGFIGIAFMVFGAIMMISLFSKMGGMEGNLASRLEWIMSGIYTIVAILYFFPIYYLFKYSSKMKIALRTRNSDLLSNALVYLKSHHRFLGIALIVVISMYLLLILGMLVFMTYSKF